MPSSSFPTDDVRLGALLVVGDVGRSRDFYRDVLSAKVLREFEGSFCQLEFQETLLFLVVAGGPSKINPVLPLPRRRAPKRLRVSSSCECQTASRPMRRSKAAARAFSHHR